MVLTLLLAAAVSTLQEANGAPPPAPIEQAVVEHRCVDTRTGITASADPYHECLAAQLASLRKDFGPGFEGLSAAERRSLDSICTRIRAAEGRERYIACLSDRLAALHTARAAGISVTQTPMAAPVITQATTASPTPGRSSRSVTSFVLAAAVLIGLAAGLAWASRRRRDHHVATTCHRCGAATTTTDLCARCRHEAALAVRAAMARDGQFH